MGEYEDDEDVNDDGDSLLALGVFLLQLLYDDDDGDDDDDDDSLLALGIFLLQLLQNVHLQLGGLPVLVHVLDDLQRQNLVPEQIVIKLLLFLTHHWSCVIFVCDKKEDFVLDLIVATYNPGVSDGH